MIIFGCGYTYVADDVAQGIIPINWTSQALHTIISLNMIIFGCGYTYVADDDDYDDNNVYYTLIDVYQ